jgi:hypothetical protein
MRTHLANIASNNDTSPLITCRWMVAKSAHNDMMDMRFVLLRVILSIIE